MIFQHTWQQVLDGSKTQTRRIFKPGDYGWVCGYVSETERGFYYSSVSNQQGDQIIKRWAVGKTYAVQPGRGQKSVGQIQITAIRREDVRRISAIDLHTEGFRNYAEFIKTWVSMHDKDAMKAYPDGTWTEQSVEKQSESWLQWIDTRPDTFYQTWVIEFKLVSKA